ETAWSISVRRLLDSGVLELPTLLQKFVENPRKILNIDIPRIAKGEEANLTLFNTDEKWILEEELIKSKSHNSPYIGNELLGRAEAIYNNEAFVKNEL